MKKLLYAFLGALFIVGIYAFVNAGSPKEERLKYIQQSLNEHWPQYVKIRECENEICQLADESDPNVHYYFVSEKAPGAVYTFYRIGVSKQVVIESGVEIYSEGVYLTSEGYDYFAEHYIVLKECDECHADIKTGLDPVEIWDEVIEHFFENE